MIGRARLLLDMSNSSPWCRRNSAPHHPNPAEAQWRWRGERSEPVRLSVRDHHSCSVYDGSRVQNGVVHSRENFGVHAPRLNRIDGHDPVRVSLEAPLKYGPELQSGIMQLEREGSPPPGLRLPQAKLSRKSNQVARGRIRRFESYMPSQPVRSPLGNCDRYGPRSQHAARQSVAHQLSDSDQQLRQIGGM